MEEKLLISGIEPQKRKKDRYNIYIDGEYAASLGAEVVVKFGLSADTSVDKAAFEQAVFDDNVQYAFDVAAGLLAHHMRTRAELEERLRQRGIGEDAIAAAMDKLAAYGYVDDAAYAREYVQSAVRARRWGRKAVACRLREKGLDSAIIDEAMAAYTEDDERDIVRAQIKAAGISDGADGRKQRHRLYQSLARHGFDYGVISALLSEEAE